MTDTDPRDYLINVKEVERLTSLRRQTIYNKMRHEGFPRPVKIGPKGVRWWAGEVETWLRSRPRVRISGVAGGEGGPAT